MKAKIIKAIIKKKFTEFVSSIEDPALQRAVKSGTIVTGGCITSMLLNERVNDFDLYFDSGDLAERVATYYVNTYKKQNTVSVNLTVRRGPDSTGQDRVKIHAKSAGVVSETDNGQSTYQYFEQLSGEEGESAVGAYVETVLGGADEEVGEEKVADKPKYRPVFLSSNAVTLANHVQLIIRFYGSPEEIHKNYDFIHCTNYWYSKTGELVLTKEALEATITKELRYVGSLYPLCSIIRTRKFLKRGWTINAGQYLKMIMQLNQLNLLDVAVLEDQLVGVDVAYFAEIIQKLQEKDPAKVDTAYLMAIIDRMF